MADHVHLLLTMPSKISVSSFMGYLKVKSTIKYIQDQEKEEQPEDTKKHQKI